MSEETIALSGKNSNSHVPLTVWPGITAGLAAAVAMWLVWYILHLPGLDTPFWLTGIAAGLALVAGVAYFGRWFDRPLASGGIAGLTAGLVGLMLLGSKIARPTPDGSELNPDAPWIVLSFLASSAALGTVGGLASSLLGRRNADDADPRQLWLRRLAIAAAASYLPLITVGGFVTSSGSGMAVPDWPGTYGSNMFLYPFALMEDPRIFFEHTHRLLGTLAGLATIILLAGALMLRGSKTVVALATVLLVGVIIQGLLGGFRVAKDLPALGALHGVLGQGLLVVATITAAFVGRALPTSAAAAKTAKPIVVLGIASLVCLAIQLAFASLYRHLGSSHALYSHIGFSIIVTGAVAHVAIFSSKYKPGNDSGGETGSGRALKKLAPAIFAVLAVQFTLGFVAWGFGSGYGDDRPIPTAEQLDEAPPVKYGRSLVATIHQANGAALAALTGLALAWALRARAGAPREASAHLPDQQPHPEPHAFADA